MFRHSEIDALAKLALSAGDLGTWRWDLGTDMVIANDTQMSLLGWSSTSQLHTMSQFLEAVVDDDRDGLRERLTTLSAEDSSRSFECRVRRPDGEVRWLRGMAEVVGPDPDSSALVVRGVDWDVTDESLREVVSDLALSAGRMGRWRWDLKSGRVKGDDTFATLHGLDPTRNDWGANELLAQIHEDDRSDVDQGLKAAFDRGTFFERTFRVYWPEGEGSLRATHWLESRGQVTRRNAGGDATEMVGVIMDVDERFRQRAELRRLNKELNHRVKNLFSVVSSLVKLSGRYEDDKDVLLEKLAGRIGALAAAHSVGIDGDGQDIPFRLLVNQVLSPYRAKGFAVTLEGPTVDLPPRMLTPMAILFNELSSNAERHGSWSQPDGTLDLSWRVETSGDQPTLMVRWHEICIAESCDPEPSGFGLVLVHQSAAQLGAELEHRVSRNGITAVLHCPLTRSLA